MQGSYNDLNQFVANTINFNGKDLQYATAQQFARAVPTSVSFLDLKLPGQADYLEVRYLDGSTLDKSVVSSRGIAPESTPFFCKRNAMIFVELLAGTEPGADT